LSTTKAALERHFAGEQRLRIALECGTHSRWVSRLLENMGHEVVVANMRKIRAITAEAFLGLRPRQSQSGDSDPQHRISKTGNN
jgi:transposase